MRGMMMRHARLAIWIILMVFGACGGCAPKDFEARSIEPPPFDRSIVCAEQNLHRIVVFRADSDWSDSANLLWEWTPQSDPGVECDHRDWFRYPTECKTVANGEAILMTASDGAVALLDVRRRRVKFYARAGGNPHSAEVLPDGNLVVASSTGNTLSLFAVPAKPSQPYFDGKPAAQYPFADAHGCVWDRERKLLWVLGRDELAAFEYNFVKSAPALVRRESYRLDDRRYLPASLQKRFPPSRRLHFYGHDLFPIPGGSELLLSGGFTLLKFDTVSRNFTVAWEMRNLKSVSVNPADGKLLFLRPTRSWWSDSLRLRDGDAYTLPGARFYKGRWFSLNRFSY